MGYLLGKQSHFGASNELYQETIPIFKKNEDWLALSAVYGRIGFNYGQLEMHEEAISYHQKGIEIDKKYGFKSNEAYALGNIASEYGDLKKFPEAQKYYQLSKQLFVELKENAEALNADLMIALLSFRNGAFKKALDKTMLIEVDEMNISGKISYYQLSANCYRELQFYNQAKGNYQKAVSLAKSQNDIHKLQELYLDFAKSLLLTHNEIEGANLLKQYDSLRQFTIEKENKQAFIDLDAKYQTAEKEAQIAQQQLKIQSEKNNRNIAIAGAGVLLLLSGGGYFWLRNRQQKKALQTENTMLALQQQLNSTELARLNTQLDPHEIKNLLASIAPEIQDKAPEAYSNMLRLFNITKASLNNTGLTEDVSTQLQQTKDYLKLMQQSLFEPLEYTIESSIDESLPLPRLMLKNLAENAVKHGIKGKADGGSVAISILNEGGFIKLIVDDTGKGRNGTFSNDSGIGLSNYQKLFETLNRKNKFMVKFEIIDKTVGTQIVVLIPENYQYT